MQIGQQGADTVTHIISITAIGLLVFGLVGIMAVYNVIPNNVDTTTHAAVVIAVCEFGTVAVIMMAYYSVQYQKTPTGQITLTTLAPDGTSTQKTVTPSGFTVVGPDGKPIPIPPGSTIQSS